MKATNGTGQYVFKEYPGFNSTMPATTSKKKDHMLATRLFNSKQNLDNRKKEHMGLILADTLVP